MVAAAGNAGTAGLDFPAVLPSVISVGSSNWLDQRSEFSSFAGPGEVLDVLAPGELIWSTAVVSAYDALLYEILGLPGFEPGTPTYAQADGTSFAAPLVSGYVGLILSQNPGATLQQVPADHSLERQGHILDPGGSGLNLTGYDPFSGFGRIRMVVPTLNPGQNTPPFANAGSGSRGLRRRPGPERVGHAQWLGLVRHRRHDRLLSVARERRPDRDGSDGRGELASSAPTRSRCG